MNRITLDGAEMLTRAKMHDALAAAFSLPAHYGRILDLARTGGWRLTLSSPAARPGRYRHFKGGEYECLGLALHSETLAPVVVYRALYGSRGLWVRPAAMWAEEVAAPEGPRPRFLRVEDSDE